MLTDPDSYWCYYYFNMVTVPGSGWDSWWWPQWLFAIHHVGVGWWFTDAGGCYSEHSLAIHRKKTHKWKPIITWKMSQVQLMGDSWWLCSWLYHGEGLLIWLMMVNYWWLCWCLTSWWIVHDDSCWILINAWINGLRRLRCPVVNWLATWIITNIASFVRLHGFCADIHKWHIRVMYAYDIWSEICSSEHYTGVQWGLTVVGKTGSARACNHDWPWRPIGWYCIG